MFTPKIIHDEDPDPGEPNSDGRFTDDGAELELPADLTLLAGRLAREAAMLADRYPAETAPAFPPPEVRLADSKAVQRAAPPPANRGQAGRFFGPALALLLAISVAAVFVWSQSNDGPAEPVGGKQEWSVSFRPAGDRQPSETSTGEESPGAGVPLISSPATFVHELTGPEIEGLLDLLECEDAAESRLSI